MIVLLFFEGSSGMLLRYVICGFVCLTGCNISMPKQEQVKYIQPTPSIQKSVKESLSTPFFTQGDWPKGNWWTIFKSPELDCLVNQALINNPTIQEAWQRVRAAKQEARIANSQLYPLVYFEAQDTEAYLSRNGLYKALNPSLPLNTTLIDLSLEFKYEFDFWNKNANLLRAALGREMAEKAEAMQVRLMISTAVAQSYFALKANLLRKRLYIALYKLRQEESGLNQTLQKSALSSSLIPLLSTENVLEAKKFLNLIENEIATDKHLLNILMGRSPDAVLKIDACLPPLPEHIALPCHISSGLIARRPDLMAQIWRAKAIAYQVGAAIADFYPDFNLAALAGLESISFAQLFDAGSLTASITPSIYLPIFTGYAIEANVGRLKALFQEAIFAYNKLLLASVQEVADLLSFAKSVYLIKSEQNSIIDITRKRLNLAKIRNKTGLDSKFEEYAIQDSLIQKELENTTLIYNQYLVSLKLIKALGGGYCASCVPLQANCKSID